MLKKLAVLMVLSLAVLLLGVSNVKAEDLGWERVVGAGAAQDKGFGEPDNTAGRIMIQFGNYLYVATSNMLGTEVWRSQDGVSWEKVATGGFGDAGNIFVWSGTVFDGSLYLGTGNASGGEVWRSSNGTDWFQVGGNGLGNANNNYITSFSVFNGIMYVGTYNDINGAHLYNSLDGLTYNTVLSNGIGGDANNEIILSSIVYQDQLYLSYGNTTSGAEIWKTPDALSWTQSGADGFGLGTSDFGEYTLAIHNGRLYAAGVNIANGSRVFGTSDGVTWIKTSDNYDVPGSGNVTTYSFVSNQGYLYAGLSTTSFARVFRSQDGANWTQANSDGFGNQENVSVLAMVHFNGYIYASTAKSFINRTGFELYRLKDNSIVSALPATGGRGDNGKLVLYAAILAISVSVVIFARRARRFYV